jgi:hypothetical protein
MKPIEWKRSGMLGAMAPCYARGKVHEEALHYGCRPHTCIA